MKSGYNRDPKSSQDWLYGAMVSAPTTEQPRVNYESILGPAFDQGDTFECVCFAIEGLKRYHEYEESQAWLSFDAHEFYTQCKARDGFPNGNGTLTRVAMDALREIGMLASDGKRYTIASAARLSTIDEIRHSLAGKAPVLIGLQIDIAEFAAMSNAEMIGIEPAQSFAGHCMLSVGYDDDLKSFRIRNSWGSSWGDSGHCWLEYAYLEQVDPQFDAWATIDGAAVFNAAAGSR